MAYSTCRTENRNVRATINADSAAQPLKLSDLISRAGEIFEIKFSRSPARRG